MSLLALDRPLSILPLACYRRSFRKIKSGKKLSPLLLVCDAAHGKVIIADGYHRMCAVYGYNEDALIPCKIV